MGGMRWIKVAVVAAVLSVPLVPMRAQGILPGQLPGMPGPTPLCQTEAGATEATPDARPSPRSSRANPRASSSAPVRVATYNILQTQDPDGRATIDQRIDLLAEAIASSGLDVAGLQEVAKTGLLRGDRRDDDDEVEGLVVELLARQLVSITGETWHWCYLAANPHFPYEPEPAAGGGGGPLTEVGAIGAGPFTGNGDEFREGVALLSRYPITDAVGHRLPMRTHEVPACSSGPMCAVELSQESRAIVGGVVQFGAEPVEVFSTHFSHTVTAQSNSTRELQAEDAVAYLADQHTPGRRLFFVGDFNTREGQEPYRIIQEAGFVDTFRAFTDADGFTSPQDVVGDTATVRNRIDFVWTLDGCPPEVLDSRVFGDTPADRADEPGTVWPSDHYGVVSTLACA
jgi:endonuclease/exonuclease/phosphatase family metal-dependent hydrolase